MQIQLPEELLYMPNFKVLLSHNMLYNLNVPESRIYFDQLVYPKFSEKLKSLMTPPYEPFHRPKALSETNFPFLGSVISEP